ncbi:asparagine synthase (glutamine-hydrolyzing) [Maribacter chungangensis]|uniref:asparagine synthase (glutamine-hydrolyzing) n=1 Tax=Maribacter chungangensis TaxID=1069117 RepID=A0ABW3BA22_9FLAO
MCGINGFITSNSINVNDLKADIQHMNDLIIHRGPDDDGVFTEVQREYGIALGMRRLSIIDLTSGKQPILSSDKQLAIVFNGEIYNYKILRNALISKGLHFKTNSDTEVILKLYELEGEQSFKKLDGMFAFSIYDKRRKKLFIARDFFGEKPLYYTKHNDKFIWASELKSLLKVMKSKPEISIPGLNLYFRLTYIPAPHTIYKNIFKLEANSYLVYDLDTHDYQTNSIEDAFRRVKSNLSFNKAKIKTKELVTESVASRSISDVPIGTFLSGGVDSSIVSLCLAQMSSKKINTFSIGFKKKSYDESDRSRIVAKQINSQHHEYIIGEEDLKDNISEILLNFDEPFSDSSALPTYLVSKKTGEQVKVALTGDGGDEIFGGYNKYYVGKINNRYTSIVPKGFHQLVMGKMGYILNYQDDKRGQKYRIKKMLNSVSYDGSHYWDMISLANTEHQLNKLLKSDIIHQNIFSEYKRKLLIEKPNSLTEYRFIDKIISLEGDMLVKVDRTSMLNSLECRAPFLNKKLWGFTNSLPEKYLMKGWDKKHILKEAFKEDFPKDFLNLSKRGFGAPVGDWLQAGLNKEVESYISTPFLKKQNLFNVSYIQELVRNHLTGIQDSTFQVWNFYCFQKWYVNIYEQL